MTFSLFDRGCRLSRALVAVLITSTMLFSTQTQAQERRWSKTVSKAADSVVSIKLSQLRSFGDSRRGGSSATGFVVDAERGIILTNRHVVGAGPIRLSATFQNQERVDAVPLYRDPVHDFAFIRFDPAALQYTQPNSLQLRPEKVRTGMDIRVIGSDGGEQLSILTGTIARLDREVPGYGRYGYNDFNTFYYQAASGTSGGSSGSPVIDIDGDVVALNAAANSKTASSFFLPLDRIKYTLERLQNGEEIQRGGLQTIFQHKPFRQLLRLGLSPDVEARSREKNQTNSGLLMVGQVMAGGVADGKLLEGDVLTDINGEFVTNFIEYESLLDASIGETLDVTVVRQGNEKTVSVPVVDLNEISPKRFLEIGDSVLQNLSIQHIRALARGGNGVVVTDGGYYFSGAGVSHGSVITAAGGMPVNNLDDFLTALSMTPANDKLRIEFYRPGSEYVARVAQLDVDDRWFGNKDCVRVDDVRFWDCKAVNLSRSMEAKPALKLRAPQYRDPLLATVGPAMVSVKYSVPFHADNVYASFFNGTGMIVDAEMGLVAVDRNTVPVSIGDAEITLFGSTPVPAKVVFLHPRHNVALLQFDASLLGDKKINALQFAKPDDEVMGSLVLVGYGQAGTLRTLPVDTLNRQILGTQVPSLPRFQQTPTDVFTAPNLPASVGGPIVDSSGLVHAVQMSFAFEDGRDMVQQDHAMPAAVLEESIRLFKSGKPYRSIDARLSYRSLSVAREWGLSDDWLRRYNELTADKRRVLYVEQTIPGTASAEVLKSGDVILAVNGELVSGLFDIELLTQKDAVSLTVLTAGNEKEVTLVPGKISFAGTQRLVSWAGAFFQDPMDTIGYFKSVDFPGVYIADTIEGSPALWDQLYRNRFVTAVDGIAVNDLNDLLRTLSKKQQDEITRLSVISISGRKSIVTVEPEYNYWPTYELRRNADGWYRSGSAN